ncbi:MAG: GntR family transcriptional regulator [Deltaproteobacteria bacterium]|nr:MAG: GntR family transcriptional regulator [Deltaproteobacteria bacterium]
MNCSVIEVQVIFIFKNGNNVIEIGKINRMIVARETKHGFYLVSTDVDIDDYDEEEEVFLPPSLTHLKVRRGQEITVFVYVDTKDKLIATTETPFAQVGEYADMRVVAVEEFGAFFDWGIDKDLLVPGNEQKVKVKKHERYLVRVCLEEGTDRVYGTTKLGKYIESSVFDFEEKDKVTVVPVKITDLGYKVVINKRFVGMIYNNEIFQEILLNRPYEGIVKKIRTDGLVDVALQAHGVQNLEDSKEKVLQYLKDSGGQCDLHDKSSPEEIKRALSMSKNTFKSAIGMLFKDKKIEILKGPNKGIKLIN